MLPRGSLTTKHEGEDALDPKFWKISLKEFMAQINHVQKRLERSGTPALPDFDKFNKPDELGEEQMLALDDCMDDVESYERFLMEFPDSRSSKSKVMRGRKKTMLPINLRMAPSIRKILTAYLLATKEGVPPLGSVPIICLLLQVLNHDIVLCFRLFCHLQSMTFSYFRDLQENLCRSESLVLADLLLTERPAMCKHLKRIDCDVMDLSDLAFAWCSNLFTLAEFPVEFTLRCLGQTFAQGPSVLIGITFGILLHFDPHIQQLKSPEEFFDFFASRSFTKQITLSSSEEILSEALHIMSQKSQPRKNKSGHSIGSLKRHKSWNDTIGRKCTLKFEKGFADAMAYDLARDGLNTTEEDYFARRYDTPDMASTGSVLLPEVGQTPKGEEVERLRKQVQDSNERIKDLEVELTQYRLEAHETDLLDEDEGGSLGRSSGLRAQRFGSFSGEPGTPRHHRRSPSGSPSYGSYKGPRKESRSMSSTSMSGGHSRTNSRSETRERRSNSTHRVSMDKSPSGSRPGSSRPRNNTHHAGVQRSTTSPSGGSGTHSRSGSGARDKKISFDVDDSSSSKDSRSKKKNQKFGTMPAKKHTVPTSPKAALHKKLAERNKAKHGGNSSSRKHKKDEKNKGDSDRVSMSSIFESNPTPSEMRFLKSQTSKLVATTKIEEVPTRYSNWTTVYSEVLSKLEYPCVLMQGWLYKTGHPRGIFNKQSLHRRWFVLKGPYFTYLKSPLHSKPTKDKCIDLSGCEIKIMVGHPRGEHAIEIVTIPPKTLAEMSARLVGMNGGAPGGNTHANRIRAGTANPRDRHAALPRQTSLGGSDPTSPDRSGGSSAAKQSSLASVEKAGSSGGAGDDSRSNTLKRKFLRRNSRTANDVVSLEPPTLERFVLFAMSEPEQKIWVRAMQSVARGALLETGF